MAASRLFLCLAFLFLCAQAAAAAPTGEGQIYWPFGGVSLSRAAGLQAEPQATSDGRGGMIVTWSDCRAAADDCDIYAQRVDGEGKVQWTEDGVPVRVAPGNQLDPYIVPDTAGGAIIAWSDYQNPANPTVLAQRLDAAGSLLWAAGGISVTAGSADYLLAGLVADNDGGAFVVWEQHGPGDAVDSDLYAQRLGPDGTRLWATPAGLAVVTGEQYTAEACADGSGGLIVAWADLRSPLDPNIYAQRVTATGQIRWTANGSIVSPDPGRQQPPLRVVSDAAGGAYVAWTDLRTNGRRSDVYMQRLNAAGQALWPQDKGVFTSQGLTEVLTDLIADGQGGAIVAGTAVPEVAADIDVLAQRVDGSGQTQWGEQPLDVTPWGGRQEAAVAVADRAGGAYLAWIDTYTDVGTYDIWTQHIDARGTPLWPEHGVEAIGLTGPQIAPVAVTDGLFGMLLAWQDGRSDPDNPDIYAQRVGDVLYRSALPALWQRANLLR